jgi:hypothetical protein
MLLKRKEMLKKMVVLSVAGAENVGQKNPNPLRSTTIITTRSITVMAGKTILSDTENQLESWFEVAERGFDYD